MKKINTIVGKSPFHMIITLKSKKSQAIFSNDEKLNLNITLKNSYNFFISLCHDIFEELVWNKFSVNYIAYLRIKRENK